MHGDGHGGIKHQNGFKNVDEITDGFFDIVITNPPFGSMVNDKEILSNYTLPNNNPIKEEFLFIEKYSHGIEEYSNYIFNHFSLELKARFTSKFTLNVPKTKFNLSMLYYHFKFLGANGTHLFFGS